MGKLKAMVLAVGLVLALGAVSASAASAATYNAEAAPAYLKADAESGMISFKPFGGVACQSSNWTAQMAATSASVITTTSFEQKCFHGGYGQLSVAMNGCTMRYKAPTGTGTYNVPVVIECAFGKAITIKAPLNPCYVSIGSQSFINGATATNIVGSPKAVSLSMDLTGVTYTAAGGAGCEQGTYSSGQWSDKTRVKAYTDAGLTKQTGFFIS